MVRFLLYQPSNREPCGLSFSGIDPGDHSEYTEPVFGTPRTMFNPRQFQFSRKLSF